MHIRLYIVKGSALCTDFICDISLSICRLCEQPEHGTLEYDDDSNNKINTQK